MRGRKIGWQLVLRSRSHSMLTVFMPGLPGTTKGPALHGEAHRPSSVCWTTGRNVVHSRQGPVGRTQAEVKRTTMATSTNYEIPTEARAFAEKSVAEARKAFAVYTAAAAKAVVAFENTTEVAQDKAKKASARRQQATPKPMSRRASALRRRSSVPRTWKRSCNFRWSLPALRSHPLPSKRRNSANQSRHPPVDTPARVLAAIASQPAPRVKWPHA
jgi:hypothetical protein